jgi:sugar phosphate isomerase/epimerase
LAVAATGGAPKPPSAVEWKTAVGLNGFMSSANKYKKTYPIWEVADFLARTGFDGVELVSGWPMGEYPASDEVGRIEALKGFWDHYGLQIFSMQVGVPGAFHPDAAVRAKWLAGFTEKAKLAHKLGCACIGLWPGDRLGGQTLDQAIDHCAQSYREAGKVAESEGLLVSFEIEPPFVFHREDDIKKILARSNHPHLKTMYDPSHFDLMSGSTGRPHEMLERIGVKNIGYVHFTDTDGTLRDGGTSKHLGAGDGHIDVEGSLKVLKDGGFRGWVMVDAWEIPDPYDACEKAMKAFRKAWA